MFTEVAKGKNDSPEKERTKKMILVAKDYVHFLRKRERSKCTNGSDYIKVDGTSVSVPTLGQLLASLKDDLRCATTIFLEEFIECGGIECLLDVLRLIISQQNQISSPMKPRQQQTAMRRSLVEQYDCLMCLKHTAKSMKSVKRISESSHGSSTITSCIMSSSEKARILALELLCRVLDGSSNGHTLILEALTSNRVLFGEPVRFKFLVGMLQANVSEKPVFQAIGLKFLNGILRTCTKPAEKIRLQCELEEAGLNVPAIETALREKNIPLTDGVWEEIATWRKSYLDMESVEGQKQNLESQNEMLQKEVQLLRKALQKLEEDKINLMQIEMELKEKCEDLHEEVTTLKTEIKQTKPSERIANGSNSMLKEGPNLRHFGDEDELFLLSGESGQLETEEIFIDVPTIRPPVEFRTDSTDSLQRNKSTTKDDSPKIHDKTLLFNLQNTSVTVTSSTGISLKPTTSTNSSSDKESADSALSESESDSGINWNYPDIPKTSINFAPRNSRSRSSRRVDAMSEDFFKTDSKTKRIPLHQRSQSEDRRETVDYSISRRHNLENGETKVVSSTGGFFMMKRPDTDVVTRQSSLPIKDVYSRFPVNSVAPSYQLPIAYRSNFLSRGHSNCDLYSGIADQAQKLEHSPPIPPPDYSRGVSVANSGGTISALVHREITKAVRQISGWI